LAFVRQPWLIVALVFVVASFSTVVRPATNAVVPVLAGEERAPSAYAWVATGTSIGYSAGYAAGGVLTAAFGVKGALLADTGTFATGNAISGLGIVGIGLSPGLGVALAASAVGGVGNGIANVSISSLVSARVEAAERGRAFASVSALIQAGVGTGTVAGAPLVAVFGA